MHYNLWDAGWGGGGECCQLQSCSRTGRPSRQNEHVRNMYVKELWLIKSPQSLFLHSTFQTTQTYWSPSIHKLHVFAQCVGTELRSRKLLKAWALSGKQRD